MRQKSREKTKLVLRLSLLVVVVLDLFLQHYFRSRSLGYENWGVSFGLGKQWGSVISALAYAGVIVWFVYDKMVWKRNRLFVFLLACGGMGNLVARLLWGSVWDYVCFAWLPFCFNLSDTLICLGVVSYILGVDDRDKDTV